MKLAKRLLPVLLVIGFAFTVISVVLFMLYSKEATVYPGSSYKYFIVTTALMVAHGILSFVLYFKSNKILAISKLAISLLSIPIVIVILIDDYYIYVNKCTILFFAATALFCLVDVLYTKCRIQQIIKLIIAALIIAGSIVCLTVHADFVLSNWYKASITTAAICTAYSIFSIYSIPNEEKMNLLPQKTEN